jgi:hypothetical protein
MAVPTTRATFKQYCLRSLGHPVVQVNVADEQVEDRVDEALAFYWDYHFDGSDVVYYAHQVTSDDKTNRYITLPESIIGAVRIFDVGTLGGGGEMYDFAVQMTLSQMLLAATSAGIANYFMVRQNIAFMQEWINGQKPVRYNRNMDRLYVDMDWDQVAVGSFLVVETFQVVDPTTYADVWGERWLQNYATQLIKRQWGENMKKFQGVPLPGGITMNGQQVYDEAVEAIARLEQECKNELAMPPRDFIG